MNPQNVRSWESLRDSEVIKKSTAFSSAGRTWTQSIRSNRAIDTEINPPEMTDWFEEVIQEEADD